MGLASEDLLYSLGASCRALSLYSGRSLIGSEWGELGLSIIIVMFDSEENEKKRVKIETIGNTYVVRKLTNFVSGEFSDYFS